MYDSAVGRGASTAAREVATLLSRHGLLRADVVRQKSKLLCKLHRRDARLVEHNMTLKWRAGTSHSVSGAILRLPGFEQPEEDVDDGFPDDISRPGRIFSGPRRPVLHGVPLSDLGIEPLETPWPKIVAYPATLVS